MGFLHRPQGTALRKVAFQLHLWTGLAVGLYALLIGLTGAALVFRPEMQARAYPQFFAVRPDVSLADPQVVVDALTTRFPGYRFSGIDYPTYRRGTFLSYLARGTELRTVFSDAASGRVVGELPAAGWIQRLQALHFNLLSGPTGILVNGIAATCLLAMCLTGIIIWWPGALRWRRGLTVDLRRGWKRVTWALHGAVGFWALTLLTMWAVSGIYFSFPVTIRTAVNAVAPVTVSRPPQPDPLRRRDGTAPPMSALVNRARQMVPGAQVARVVLPGTPTGAFAVVLARRLHGDFDSSDEVTFYFDRSNGVLLGTADAGQRTAGDRILTWLGLLHVGNFGGLPIKVAWVLLGLAFPLLFASGVVMWWNRLCRGRAPAFGAAV